MPSLPPLPRRPSLLAVIGIIGPDQPARRAALRPWAHAAAPELLVRFAVSRRDRTQSEEQHTQPREHHTQPQEHGTQPHERAQPGAAETGAEADVDLLDCLGQRAGSAVVQLSLFDG